mgnify:CR=1 FL=1
MFRASQSWSTRCLTGLLVMTLLLSLVPISASAVSSIGLSYSQPSVGRGSLKLYWDSAPNVEFYAYSVRDITTDESICSNERTSRTSASVSWTWENNHSYRIWAGACCTGNDPDNTSTWDYTGMDSFTVVGCPHTNTETAWDTTNHDVSYKSISDYEHKITGYEYEYCTKCFERIGKSHKVTETQAHVFDSDGDCTICNYRHSCQHKNTELVIASGFPSYKSCNAKEHTCTTLYDRVCANATCGKVVKLGDTRTTEDQPHRFNSSGRCKDCGYQKTYEKLQVSVSRSQSEAYAGSSISASASVSGGDGQYKCGWEVTCNGQTVSQTDMGMGAYYSYTASTVGQYVFTVTVTDGQGSRVDASSQSITVKAKPCEHPTYAVQWTADPRSCKSISDSEHTTTGYQYKYCTVCGVQISEKFKATETEPHQFDAAGDCLSCDYRHSCQHKDTTLVIASGFPSYKSCNDKEHTCTILYDRVCANATCGKVVKLGDTRTTEDQPHRFNSSGRCKDCGYQKSYEKLQLGVSRLKAEAYVGDTIGASASASGGDGQYNYEWQISLNGQVIDTFAGGRDDSYSITASSAGQYVFTATVTDGQGSCKTASSSAITVRAKACEHTSYTDVPGTSKYTQISDAKHKKTTLMRRVCDSCKKTLNEYNKEVSESHHFSNGSCKECGAADPNAVCKHKNATDQFAYADITGQGNTQQHIVTDTYKVVCNDCGITIRTYETRRMADHNFNSDGVCSCGYAKPNTCDHANRKTTPLRVTGYVDKGSVGHEKTSLVRVECADCGIVLSAENTVTVVENHDFTYNNTCICGSQHVHDFNEGTRISGPTYSKLDDTQHSVTEVYRKTCKTCGYQTAETKTRQEKHNLTKFVRMDKYHDPSRKYAHIVIRSCSDCGAEAPYGYDTYKYCTLCFPTPAPTAAATPKPTDAPDVGKSAEEALKSFTKEAKQEGSELNKRYDEISDIKKDSEFVRISSAIAEAYADRGLLETAPEELYEMVTDWIGYTVDAAAGHFAPDETDEMLQSLIKSMLAQQVYDLTDGTYEAGKTMQSLADASISVYGELVTKHAKGAEIAGYASAGVGLIIDTVKDVNCSAEELAELSVLTASYDSNIAQLDAMIEQCGPNSQIGQACREIKAQMKCNYLAKAKSWAKAASGIGTSIVKTETSVGIGLLAGHAASDVVKKYASSAGSFLLGGQIGGLLTYNAGAHLKAKENLLLLSIVDAQVTSSMQEAYDDGSDALQPLTALWLTTRKTGLDEAEKYYQTYNSSLFNNVFNNDTVQTVKGNIQSTQDERQTVTEIAASMGITLYQPNSEVIRPENFEVGAGDAVYIYTSLSAAYLYSLPDKTSLKLMRVPAGTHMQVLDRTTDADGNSWIKVIYKGNVGYLNNSEQTIPLN